MRALNGTIDCHGNVERDTSITRVSIEFSRKVAGQVHFHPAIAGMDEPAAVHLRPRSRSKFDAAVTAMQIDLIDHAIDGDVPVTCARADASGEIGHLYRAVTSLDASASIRAVYINVAITGMKVERRFCRNLYFQANTMPVVAKIDMEAYLVRDMNHQLDFVAVLVFGNPQPAFANFVVFRGDTRGNGAALAADDVDTAVVGIHAKGRLGAYAIVL